MLGRLPLALLSLLFATVAHSAEPTTPNDQFRQIVLRIQQKPEPPICCLKSPQPLEVVDDELLLSFEEWKAKQAQEQGTAHPDVLEKAHNPGSETEPKAERIRNGDDPNGTQNEVDPSANTSSDPRPPPKKALSPHFSIPITDRFNYASLDCSARVHEAHRGAKSASSILSSKKDRYMLSPCKTSGPQFVVVELCEDIRIDTVQLANFEFFSGVFKDFSVSVAKTYNGPYQDAGLYRAKNIRGVQSFHTTTLSDFYRYIRIDFHSHYGKEHYCPLSLLRVYGLTHLEKWKWELWEAEGGAGLEGTTKIVSAVVESPAKPSEASPTLESTQLSATHVPEHRATPDPAKPILMGPATPLKIVAETMPSPSTDTHSTLFADTDTQLNDTYDHIQTSHMQPLHTKDSIGSPSTNLPPLPSSTVLSTTASSPPTSVSLPSTTTGTTLSTISVKSVPSQASSDAISSNSSTRSTPVPTPSPSVASSNLSVPPPHAPPTTSGGESIYRTIMNRLNAVESNHTLYVRYIDQQNGAIRNVIKQLGEDIGRLEAITRSQRATYQKTMGQWERERMQMIMDYNQLRSKVDHLTEEIVLEKRLGVFQLCLLLAVLVFMGLTRGSRGEAVVVTGPAGSVREWGRRHLSLSGDWSRFVRRSVSRSPARAKPATSSPSKASAKLHPDDKIHFPRSDPEWKKTPFEQIQLNTAPLPHEYRAARQKKNSNTRSRTPSLRTGGANAAVKRTPQTAVPQRSGTPTPIRMAHLRPQLLQRSSSHGTHSSFFPGGMVPKSAKKWARTAHLHPVKPALGRDGPARVGRDENTFSNGHDDVFSAPAGASKFTTLDRENVARLPSLANPGKQKVVDQKADGGQRAGVGESEKGGRAPLRVLSYSGDDRDTESNWADTDSLVGSDAGDGNYSDVDGPSGLE